VLTSVTNHAHFQFPVHWCPDAALHLVRFPEAATYLQTTCGFPPSSIRVAGYLIAARQLPAAVARPPGQPPVESPADTPRSLIVVSNRGGREYLDLLRHLGPRGDRVQITFIAINDQPLCDEAQQLVEALGVRTWRTVAQLNQTE